MNDRAATIPAPSDSDLSVLHLFANYKWTGPADPAIRCAREVRALGVRVHFAQAAWMHRAGFHRMAVELARNHLPVRAGLGLRKHFHVPTLVRDRRRLELWLQSDGYDVLNTHLLADHLTAARTLGRLRRSNPTRPVLVRHLYDPEAPAWGWREQLAFAQTDGVVVPTESCRDGMVRRFRIEPERILVQDPPSRRVDESLRLAAGDLRHRFADPTTSHLIGITARIQPHRRFDLLWDVVAEVQRSNPQVRFVLFGRGNDEDVRRLCLEPLAERGISDSVRLAGYLHDPEYTQALRALDAFLFLVPGSDGTCRAVREAQALGLPVVATDRGMLPSMVRPHPELPDYGPSGIVCSEDAVELASALRRMLEDPAFRAGCSAAAVALTEGPRHPGRAARRLVDFYRALLDRRRLGGESSER